MSSSRPLAILGASGQLGSDIVRAAAAAGVEHVGLRHEDIEVTDPQSLATTLGRVRPCAVINSAAFHQVDRCEEDPSEAYRVNAVGSLLAARAAREVGARYVYISTDYVFDGRRDPKTKYEEIDPPAPLNVYGASKLAGEQLGALTLDDHLIVRVSSLFGVAGARGKGGNFIETILKKAREGGPLKVVNDQWMTPTYTGDAGDAIVKLAMGNATGVVHVTNPESCTWHAFASEAVSLAGLGVAIEPVSASTFPSKVRRPRNSAMATRRLQELIGTPLRPWQKALRAYLAAKGHLN
jgi:dTDP-4-dehydrorhamnose reductase